MSTILDALRKVEREAAQLAQQPSPPSDNSLPRVLAEKRNRKVFRRLLIVITIALLAGTGVAFTLGQRVFSPKETATVPEVAAVAARDKETVAPIVPAKQREEPPKPATVVKNPVPEPERLIKKEEPVPIPSKKDEATLPVTAKVLQKPALQIPLGSSPPVETRRSETIITDLDLQAIVWSEDPSNCSAMINGRLFRLGEEVGGFTVDEIARNYVYVKSELRSGKLRMIGAR